MMQPGPPYGVPTRANDADRADVCAILDNAYADGELDLEEHRQRCSSAMSAKTRSQLLDLIRRSAGTAARICTAAGDGGPGHAEP